MFCNPDTIYALVLFADRNKDIRNKVDGIIYNLIINSRIYLL